MFERKTALKFFALFILVFLTALSCNKSANNNNTASTPAGQQETQTQTQAQQSQLQVIYPISDGAARVTKKPFGIYVTPKNSPVQPEKFTGYHTGTDFETFASEQDSDVPINAICAGSLKMKKWATGYGGVAVQACKINGQDVTVIYGHLNIDTVSANVGDELSQGQHLAMLGKGYSTQTDGERKHLHLGIHKGTAVNILGYVQNKANLSGWIDFQSLVSK
ncbi:peptidoglycan DD-metalloendopeptidase family protein [Patescibacteria group bacterium]|nr:peptidoglycan DD-metalloendopeptidase family protein [Patescibacteria group bacterium]